MNTPIVRWYKADGSAAVDMQVALHTQWFRCGPRDRPSFQTKTAAGPVGSFGLEFTNADVSAALSTTPALVSAFPADALSTAPTQPAGSGATTMICVDSIGEWFRATWTPTSGGTGVLPTPSAISMTERVED